MQDLETSTRASTMDLEDSDNESDNEVVMDPRRLPAGRPNDGGRGAPLSDPCRGEGARSRTPLASHLGA
eukprot:9255496-Lingulodinium_polyedra.AAC.1